MLEARFRPIDKWPGDRTRSRKRATFRTPYNRILDHLERELRHLRARNIVIQSGFALEQIRNDGWPRGSAARPADPGIILSFEAANKTLSFPCDTYTDWQHNLYAIALALEALRAVDRYGVTRRAEQYQGWAKLPASPAADVEAAAAVLAEYAPYSPSAIKADLGVLEEAVRAARRKTHPDAGGSHDLFVRVEQAAQTLRRARGA